MKPDLATGGLLNDERHPRHLAGASLKRAIAEAVDSIIKQVIPGI